VRSLCEVGLKGAAARTTLGDVRTARSERSERLRTAASHASRRGWGFGVFTTNLLPTTYYRAAARGEVPLAAGGGAASDWGFGGDIRRFGDNDL